MSGWPPRKLSEVLRIQNGFAFDSKRFTTGGGMPLIRIRDLKNGLSTETNFDGPFDQRYVVRKGDFLIGMDGEFGCFEWRGTEALLNQRVCKLTDFAAGIEPRFLFYGINSYLKGIEDVTTFTTVKHLSSKQIAAIEFPLPPLKEQGRIVAMLDEAFAAIATATANAEKNLANARELAGNFIEAILSAESDQRSMALAEAADPTCTLSYGIVQPGDDIDGGLPLVRPVDLQQEVVRLHGLKRIDPKIATSYQRTTLRGEEILLCVRGTTGTISLASPELAGGNVTRGIVPIRFNPALVSRAFGYYLMRSAAVQKQIRVATYGTALMQINIRDLKKVGIRIPSLTRQAALSERLDRLNADLRTLQEAYSQKLAALSQLKQSLLNSAFSGELTERATSLPAPVNDNFATPEFAAQVLAFAHSRHVALGRTANFGRVKAQKTLQAVEAIGGLDLGRQPIKDAAGPNDSAHMGQAENWAMQQGFFEFVQRTSRGYDFRQLKNYDTLLADAKQRLEQAGTTAKSAVELLVDMDSDFAEIIVTTHAAWNNLILDKATTTDNAIVRAARDDWHHDKLRYDKSRFHDAIRFIRNNGIEPDGSAKRVGGQESLPL